MERTVQSYRGSLLVGMYLAAIVAANLSVAHFGKWALPVTAWVLIPFDLVTRDVLHEKWKGKRLWVRMALLIAGGSALSLLLNVGAWRIALASCLAFGAAGVVDTVVYWLLRGWDRFSKMNISNIFSAVTDSVIFPWVAFGVYDSLLSGSQAGAKFVGGLFWSVIFIRLWLRREDHA